MRKRYPNQSRVRWIYWGISAFAILTVSAWQFGWPPFGDSPSDLSSSLGDGIDDAVDPVVELGGADPFPEEGDGGFVDEPMIVEQHAEPALDEESYAGIGLRERPQPESLQRPVSLSQDELSKTPDMPGRFTTGASANTSRKPLLSREPKPMPRTDRRRKRSHLFLPGDITPVQRANRGSALQISNQVVDSPKQSEQLPPELIDVDRKIEADEYVDAHRILSTLYWKKPEWRAEITKRIEKTARSIYFAPQPHYMEAYVVQPGDRLSKIAGRYQVTWQYLETLNRIDARRIRPGQKLKVIKGPFSVDVSLSNFELTVHARGYFVRRYKIGIGKDGATPVGTHMVLNKVENPQYTNPEGKVIAADDLTNPLGERWIDIGDGYGIHGTIDPKSIGEARSKGCIRMRNEDVEELYNLLTIGSQVVIRRGSTE